MIEIYWTSPQIKLFLHIEAWQEIGEAISMQSDVPSFPRTREFRRRFLDSRVCGSDERVLCCDRVTIELSVPPCFGNSLRSFPKQKIQFLPVRSIKFPLGNDKSTNQAPPCRAFQKISDTQIEAIQKSLEQDGAEEKKDKKRIRCRFCKNKITSVEYGIEVNGHHQHTFTNPSGISYQIGCFSLAGGCVSLGTPTEEFTWFSGFRWCFSLCSNCHSHLGWHYRGGEGKSFYGLILKNLVEEA